MRKKPFVLSLGEAWTVFSRTQPFGELPFNPSTSSRQALLSRLKRLLFILHPCSRERTGFR